MEQVMSSLNLNVPIISNQAAQQQGQQVGQQLAQGAEHAVHQQAPQVTAPIADSGNSTGSALGRGIVAGVIAAKTGELIAKGLGTAVELSDTGSKLQASLGLSDEDAAKYQSVIKDLYGGAYVDSMEEASGAIESVISSIDGMKGASNEAVTDMTKKVLTLSNAFEVDAAESTQVLGQLIRQGMVKDANEGLDLITKSFQQMPKNVRAELLANFDEYSVHLKALGYTGKDAFNLMTNAARGGSIMLDKSNDALKEFMIISTDISAAGDAYKALGLNGDEMVAKLLAGGPAAKEAFQKITGELAKIENKTKQKNLAKMLFGTPLEDMGLAETKTFIDSLTGVNDALGQTTGAAEKAGNAINSGLAYEMKKAQNSFDMALSDVALPLMQALIPVLKDLAGWISENRQVITDWLLPLLTIGTVVGTVVAAISAFQVIAGVLMPVIAALTAAQWTWNAALFASPLFIWTAVIAGVILAIILLATHWKEVTTFIADSINWIGEQLQNLADWFNNLFKGIGDFFNAGGSWTGALNISGGLGVPMFANGGLVDKPTLLMAGEAGNEVIMNEGVYNAKDKAVTTLINNLNNNGGTGGGNVQKNYYTHVDPRQVEAVTVASWRQMNGL
jgi:phage-related minor tail protein